MSNSPYVFPDEIAADRVALRLIDAGEPVAYVVPTKGGFWVSPTFVDGAVTRWSRNGSVALRPLSPLVRIV